MRQDNFYIQRMFQGSAGSLQADEMQEEKNQIDAEIMKYGSTWESEQREEVNDERDALFGHISGFGVVSQEKA